MKTILLIVIYLLIFIHLLSILCKQVYAKESFIFDQSIPIESNNATILKSFKGYNSKLNTYLDIKVIDIDLNSTKLNIKPVVSENLDTVKNIAINNNAIACINGGYFDYENHKSVSYVIIDGKISEDPNLNKNLTNNSEIKSLLPKILDRSTLKFTKCKEKDVIEINNFSKNPKDCTIKYAIQAGPQLLPELQLEKEAFLVIKKGKVTRESASVTRPVARTAIGLTKDNHMLWVIASAGITKGKYYALTIYQLVELMKELKAIKAIAMDGGTSSSLFISLPDGNFIDIIGKINSDGKRIKPKIKSALVLIKGT